MYLVILVAVVVLLFLYKSYKPAIEPAKPIETQELKNEQPEIVADSEIEQFTQQTTDYYNVPYKLIPGNYSKSALIAGYSEAVYPSNTDKNENIASF